MGIPNAIALVVRRPFMVLAAIDFDHEPVADHEVDPTDTRDDYLACNRQPAAKVLPDSCLRSALTDTIGGPEPDTGRDEERTHAWPTVENAVDAQLSGLRVCATSEIGEGGGKISQ